MKELFPVALHKAALQVTVEVLMLPDRNEVNDIPLVINDVGNEPLVLLGLEFLHPNVSKRTTLPVASVWILENLCLHFVKPADNGWREAFLLGWLSQTVAWLMMVPWVVRVMSHYGGLPLITGILIFVAMSLFLGLYGALFALVVRWLPTPV